MIVPYSQIFILDHYVTYGIWQAAVMIEFNNVIVQLLSDNCAIKYIYKITVYQIITTLLAVLNTNIKYIM